MKKLLGPSTCIVYPTSGAIAMIQSSRVRASLSALLLGCLALCAAVAVRAQAPGLQSTDPLITRALHNQGAWSSNALYYPNDLVNSGGLIYFNSSATVLRGTAPPSTGWTQLSGSGSGGGGGGTVTINGVPCATGSTCTLSNFALVTTGQLNNTVYVVTTIQAAVTAACTAGYGRVVIQSGVSPSDTIGAVTGCPTVAIADERSGVSLIYTTTSTTYVQGGPGVGRQAFGVNPGSSSALAPGMFAIAAPIGGTTGHPYTLYGPTALTNTSNVPWCVGVQAATLDAQNNYGANMSPCIPGTDFATPASVTAAKAAAITASDPVGTASGLVVNTQTASTGGVTENMLVYPDPANLPNFTVAPVNTCGTGPAASTVAAGSTFRVLDPLQTYPLIADGAVVAGDLLVGSPTVPGQVHDSGQTATANISQAVFVCGKALTAAASAGATVTVDPVGRGLRGGKIDTLATGTAMQSQISSILSPPLSGLSGLYDFTSGSLADISGSGAAAITNGVAGANLATYVAGIGYTCLDSGITYTTHCVMPTPFQTFRGVLGSYCGPAESLTSGTTSNTLAPQFPTLLGATVSTGVRISASPYSNAAPNSYSSGNTLQIETFNSATNLSVAASTVPVGDCHHFAVSIGLSTDSAPNNVDRLWIDAVEQPYRGTQGASGSIVTLTGSNVYGLMNFGGFDTFGLRGAITDWAFSPTPLSTANVLTHMAWQDSLIAKSPALKNRYYPPMVPGGPFAVLDCDSIFAGLFQTTPWYTQLSFNRPYTIVNASMAGQLDVSCAANFNTKLAPYLRSPGSILIHDGGTNDASLGRSVAEAALADQIIGAKLASLGARGVLTTMLSSSNTTPVNGQSAGATFDTFKKGLNLLRRAGMGNWTGWKIKADLAAVPALGGDGNASNTTCFNGGLHPVSTAGCLTIGSTSMSASQAMAAIVSSAVNEMDGYTVDNPNQVAATAYTFQPGDGAIAQTPTASITDVAQDCLVANRVAIINNAAVGSGFNITLGTQNSETVLGNPVIAPGTTGIFKSVVASLTAGGCAYQRIQ